MERVSIADLDSYMGPADVKVPITDAVGATDMAINYFELAPGESFAFGRHRHLDQEELFYLQQGTATFETGDGDDPDRVSVTAGEVIRFEPGEWQRGVNEGDERVIALALGAPRDTTETTVTNDCPECGERTLVSIEMTDDGDALVTICQSCGAETGRYN